MPATRDFSIFMRPRPDGLVEMDFAVEGVSCGGCIRRIEEGLKGLPSVANARVNFSTRRLNVAWNKDRLAAARIIDAVERLGYHLHPFAARQSEGEDARAASQLLRALVVAGFAAMNVMLLSVSVWSGNVSDITSETRDFFHWLSALIALPACAYAGQVFFRSAFAALRARSVNMDVPISLGILLALGLSLFETINHAEHAYYDSAVMLLFFLLCGRYLDRAMRAKTRVVAGSLSALRAETAHKLDAKQQLIEVPVAALAPGDRIMVRAGDRVPADGLIVAGSSALDESLITGETAPRAVGTGDAIYAGSHNLSGALTLRVTAASEKTLLDEIERLLDRAVQSKSRNVQLAERASRYYAPLVHTAAALTLAAWLIAGASIHHAIVVAISVLIITCPCALVLAVPIVQVIAAGRLFRASILLNSGDAIERLAEADTVVFDKTGTLTLPEPHVVNASELPADLMRIASRLALSSRHPLAAAVASEGLDKQPYPDASEQPGAGVSSVVDGVEARLGSADFCGVDHHMAPTGASAIAFRYGDRRAVFQVQQRLRPGAAETVRRLAGLGLDLRILSGDRAQAVAPVATALGIADWQAGMNPAQKVAALQALRASGRRVLMVGDGLNDAPALAAAHVSLSPITAADLSQAHADAVFLGTRLDPVCEAITVARFARKLMLQNLWLAASYNAIAVPVAMAGLVTPLIAALAMSGSSLLVTLNALRLRERAGPQRTASPVATPQWSVP